MADRVTIQDIADALGVSRNTVSKAINNTGLLADATRERVLKKAVEMGYKQFSYVNIYGSGKAEVSPTRDRQAGDITVYLQFYRKLPLRLNYVRQIPKRTFWIRLWLHYASTSGA